MGNCREERLQSIEFQISRLDNALESLVVPGKSTSNHDVANRPHSNWDMGSPIRNAAAHITGPQPEENFYQGDSSFNAHSAETCRILENAINMEGQKSHMPTLRGTLSSGSLRRTTRNDKLCSHSHFEHNLAMPSRDLILKAVRIAKGSQIPVVFEDDRC